LKTFAYKKFKKSVHVHLNCQLTTGSSEFIFKNIDLTQSVIPD